MYKYLEELCSINGISGDESQVRDYIIEQIKEYCEYTIDALGNIIARKKGKEKGSKTVMVCAHVDEVGMIVTGFTPDGMLRIAAVGGVDARVILGRTVTVGNGITGVIGTKAVHMQSAEERDSAVPMDKLYVDIGAEDKEDARQHVCLGDSVYFQGGYREFGENCIRAKAIDDRAGCAVLIDLIRSDIPYDTVFVFNTQEEIGLRGAKVSAFSVNPDIAIVLEATTAADLTDIPEHKQVCKLGGGAVVGFMDRATIYDKKLYRQAFRLSAENGIACQTKSMIAGGNDAGAISQAHGGVRTIALSVPCRYLHSPFCVIKKQDVEAVRQLTYLMLEHAMEM